MPRFLPHCRGESASEAQPGSGRFLASQSPALAWTMGIPPSPPCGASSSRGSSAARDPGQSRYSGDAHEGEQWLPLDASTGGRPEKEGTQPSLGILLWMVPSAGRPAKEAPSFFHVPLSFVGQTLKGSTSSGIDRPRLETLRNRFPALWPPALWDKDEGGKWSFLPELRCSCAESARQPDAASPPADGSFASNKWPVSPGPGVDLSDSRNGRAHWGAACPRGHLGSSRVALWEGKSA